MPWTGTSFHKHNHGLSPAQSSHAAHIANHVLQTTGNEGEAIATANKLAHRDAGGGIGGSSPAQQGMNPMKAQMIQRYAGLPTEKLAELANQIGDSPQGAVIQQLLMQRRMQPQNAPAPATQAPQAPQAKAGGSIPHLAAGGEGMSPSQATPWWTRSDARGEDSPGPSLGFLHGPTPGRADAIDTTAPAGSHVIPADVVAGLGEGNSLAGAARMEQVIRTGPHGIPLPGGRHGSGPPRPPSPAREAKGGNIPEHAAEPENTPVKLSHGEYVVSSAAVNKWGKGDQKLGHNLWDAWIVAQRKKHIKTLKNLPGPVKS